MATKAFLIGITVHLEKGATVWTLPMADLSYSIGGNIQVLYKGKFLMSDTAFTDIDNNDLSDSAAVHAYLGQFMGAKQIGKGSNATLSSVTSVATTSTLLLAANEHRTNLLVRNESTSTLYIKYGSAASATSWTHKITGASTSPLEIGDYKGVLFFFHSALDGTIELCEIHI